MKKTLAFIALSILFLSLTTAILAKSDELETDEETVTEVDDQEVTDNLKERLQKTIQGSQNEITTSSNALPTGPRAFVGDVTDIIQGTINIRTKDGTRYTTTTEDTIIIRSPGNKEIDSEDIQIDDYIISMGYLKEKDNLEAKRIIVSTSLTNKLNKTTGRGEISSIATDSISVILSGDSEPTIIYVNSTTIIKNRDEIVEFEDLIEGDNIIFTADTDDDELNATIIMTTNQQNKENLQDLTSEENNLE